jgi:hypothetical protein
VHGSKVVACNHAGGPFLCLSNDLFSGGAESDIVRAERSADILEGDQRSTIGCKALKRML